MPEPAPATETDLALLRERILDFVLHCPQPVLKEEGAEPLAITPERFQIQTEGDSLLLEAWDDRRTVTRRVTAERNGSPRELTLAIRKFGGREGKIAITGTARRGADLDRNLRRKNFREQFRVVLNRQFPGCKITALAAERDLRRSFSEHYARALVVRGRTAWGCIGVSEAEGDTASAGILTDGLLWLDYLRSTGENRVVSGLCVFLPERAAALTAHRIAFLDASRATYQLFPIPAANAAQTPVEPLTETPSFGNLRTELRTPRLTASIAPGARERLAPIAAFPGVEEEITAQGELSLRFRGLEIAHANAETVTMPEIPMAQIARIRAPESPERRHPLYTRAAEGWMESLLKADLTPLALELAQSPVYSQVLSEAGRARGIMDLLAITPGGRLVIIELKADENTQLPFQALDYWMRVKWHLERGDFETRGFFPGHVISKEPPLLWMVFPAIRLHPSNEVVLRYFSPQVSVTRLGINEDWRKGIRVVFRG